MFDVSLTSHNKFSKDLICVTRWLPMGSLCLILHTRGLLMLPTNLDNEIIGFQSVSVDMFIQCFHGPGVTHSVEICKISRKQPEIILLLIHLGIS